MLKLETHEYLAEILDIPTKDLMYYGAGVFKGENSRYMLKTRDDIVLVAIKGTCRCLLGTLEHTRKLVCMRTKNCPEILETLRAHGLSVVDQAGMPC